jgi:hypothetical protein
MIAYNNLPDTGDVDQVAASMKAALAGIVSCEVTRATRSTQFEDIVVREGQYIGLLDDHLVTAGYDMKDVVRDLLKKAGADERELLTVYYGDGLSEADAQALVDALSPDFTGQEFQIINGSQPLYPYIISVE